MRFHDEYDVYAFLGNPAAPPLWYWSSWQRVLPELDAVLQHARGGAAVRSTQYLPNQGGTIKFGRFLWSEKDQQKWTHASPARGETSVSWHFVSAEMWDPSWSQCEKENVPPDIFMSIGNELKGASTLSFNPVVLLAVKDTLNVRSGVRIKPLVNCLGELIQARLTAFQHRPWGRAAGSVGFTNAIQDLHVTGLFKPGPRHEKTVGLDLLAGEWEDFRLER